MRVVVWWILRIYQLTLSGLIGRHCRFEPSCSHYAQEAVMRFGVFQGGLLALKRIGRCGPFGGHGYDPVPDHPNQGVKEPETKRKVGCACGRH